MVADTFAPQHNQRVPRGTALVAKRVPLTAADKKKVNKASVGLPILRTLKLASGNCFPFILKDCIPLGDIRGVVLRDIINNRNDSGLTTVSEARRPRLPSTSGPQQRDSLGGTTLYSVAEQANVAAPQEQVQGPSENFQDHPTSANAPLQIRVSPHSSNTRPELAVNVNGGLGDISTPIASESQSPILTTQLEYSDFISNLDLDEETWDFIERGCRQRKSRLRQIPINMSIETNDNSIRGSNNTRPSGSHSRSGDSHTRTTANAIKDHPGTSARRPKNMPSGSQLPSCWNDDMDQFICHMEAQGEFSVKTIIKASKQRFPELKQVGALDI